MATYQSLTDQIKKRATKKLANHTYIVRDGENLAIRLHDTNILIFKPDGHIVVTSGGWKTVPTKARINKYLGSGRPSISQDRGIWYWVQWKSGWGRIGLYKDDDVINPKGLIVKPTPIDGDKKQLKLRNQIKTFAKLCASKIPLDRPGGGDCLYCQGEAGTMPGCNFQDGTVENGRVVTRPMDFRQKVDHLQTHMTEKYVVPAMVYNAMKEDNVAPVTWWGAFKGEAAMNSPHNVAFARRGVQRAVEKYLRRRLGLPV